MHLMEQLIGALFIFVILCAMAEARGSDDPVGQAFSDWFYWDTYREPNVDFAIFTFLLWGGIIVLLVSLVVWPGALGTILHSTFNHP